MTLVQQLNTLVLRLAAVIVTRPEVVRVATYAAMQTAVSGRVRECHFVVAADETTLDSGGNAQKTTYWFDGTTLYYPALVRADGSVTNAVVTMPLICQELADTTTLAAAATGTAYKKIFVLNDGDNGGGFSEYTYSPAAGLKLVVTY